MPDASQQSPLPRAPVLSDARETVQADVSSRSVAVTSSFTGTEIVAPDAMRIIDQTRAHTATLFACHPLGSTRERIVVHLALA